MSPVLPFHLGSLHAYETVLLALIAFGPFVVLAFVVAARRRQDLAEEHGSAGDEVASRQDAAGGGA